jgi:hypothetical protein
MRSDRGGPGDRQADSQGRRIVSRKGAEGPAQFWLGLASYQGSANRRSPSSFREATTLYLTADSKQLEIRVKDYRKDFFEINRLLTEEARAEIGSVDLQKLVNARRIEGKWGSAEFKFSDATLASLKNFISRQASTVNGR